jgi:hypothetical protein
MLSVLAACPGGVPEDQEGVEESSTTASTPRSRTDTIRVEVEVPVNLSLVGSWQFTQAGNDADTTDAGRPIDDTLIFTNGGDFRRVEVQHVFDQTEWKALRDDDVVTDGATYTTSTDSENDVSTVAIVKTTSAGPPAVTVTVTCNYEIVRTQHGADHRYVTLTNCESTGSSADSFDAFMDLMAGSSAVRSDRYRYQP